MATSTPERVAIERAIAIITAFCTTIESDSFDEEAGEALFDIIDDLERPLLNASTDEEEEVAREAFSKTIIALAAMINSLLCALVDETDKFDVLAGIAEQLYRSMCD